MKKIYILRQVLADNIKHIAESSDVPREMLDPPIVVELDDGKVITCHEISFVGQARLKYEPDAPKALQGHPLSLIAGGIAPGGAKLYLEVETAIQTTTWGKGTIAFL